MGFNLTILNYKTMIKKVIHLLAIVASSFVMFSCDPYFTFNYNIENKTSDSVRVVGYNAWQGLYNIQIESASSYNSIGSIKSFTIHPKQKIVTSWFGITQVYDPMSEESVEELLQGVCDSITFIRSSDSSCVTFRSQLFDQSHEKGFFDLQAWTMENQSKWESVRSFIITDEMFDTICVGRQTCWVNHHQP